MRTDGRRSCSRIPFVSVSNNFNIMRSLQIGINPGMYAAYKGHHYAGPGNHFCKYKQHAIISTDIWFFGYEINFNLISKQFQQTLGEGY